MHENAIEFKLSFEKHFKIKWSVYLDGVISYLEVHISRPWSSSPVDSWLKVYRTLKCIF